VCVDVWLTEVWRLQGTFLVRPSLSLAGAMVLSVVVDGVVKHMALDGNQLDTRSLEVWIRDVREAVELLDEATGHRTPKEQVSISALLFSLSVPCTAPNYTAVPSSQFQYRRIS